MMKSTTNNHKGYTIYKQPQGNYYVCGLKVVVNTLDEAVRHIDDYLNNNPKARRESLIKEAKTSF